MKQLIYEHFSNVNHKECHKLNACVHELFDLRVSCIMIYLIYKPARHMERRRAKTEPPPATAVLIVLLTKLMICHTTWLRNTDRWQRKERI